VLQLHWKKYSSAQAQYFACQNTISLVQRTLKCFFKKWTQFYFPLQFDFYRINFHKIQWIEGLEIRVFRDRWHRYLPLNITHDHEKNTYVIDAGATNTPIGGKIFAKAVVFSGKTIWNQLKIIFLCFWTISWQWKLPCVSFPLNSYLLSFCQILSRLETVGE